jgi:hypothetical protein
MTDTNPTAPPIVSLDDWCRQKSKTVGKQVEMLSGFYFSEKRAGKSRDTAANFEQAFKDFADAPVIEPAQPKVRPIRKSN